jgi:hypothetical protein
MNKENLVFRVESLFCEEAEGLQGELRVVLGVDTFLMNELRRRGTKLFPISKKRFVELYENYLSNMEKLSTKPWVSLPPEADGDYNYYCQAGFIPIRTRGDRRKSLPKAGAQKMLKGFESCRANPPDESV